MITYSRGNYLSLPRNAGFLSRSLVSELQRHPIRSKCLGPPVHSRPLRWSWGRMGWTCIAELHRALNLPSARHCPTVVLSGAEGEGVLSQVAGRAGCDWVEGVSLACWVESERCWLTEWVVTGLELFLSLVASDQEVGLHPCAQW